MFNFGKLTIQSTLYEKQGIIFVLGVINWVEREELDVVEADDSAVHPKRLDYEKDGTNDGDDKEDAAEYTISERASLKIMLRQISVLMMMMKKMIIMILVLIVMMMMMMIMLIIII